MPQTELDLTRQQGIEQPGPYSLSTQSGGAAQINFPPDIYKGLQLPAKKNPLKKKVKEVLLKPAMTDEEIAKKEGEYFDESAVDTIFDEDVDVYGLSPTGDKKLLAKLRKSVIDPEIVKTGWEGYWITAGPSRSRGAAAGPINQKGAYWSKRQPVDVKKWSASYMQNGKKSKMRVNNNVFSSVLGYFEATPFMKVPCRLTSYTTRYWKYYKHGLPFIKALDSVFQQLVPEPYKKQKAAALKKPLLHIEDTAFSSVTINRNFRTALHKDAGDFKEGFGNLSVIERGKYHGGYTMFPQYRVGFNLRAGDFIAMDVHQWHCNTELYETESDKKYNQGLPKIHKDSVETGTLGSDKPFTRISFVCYLREKLATCDENETRRYFKKIGYNPDTDEYKPNKTAGKTRKVKNSQKEE